MYIQDVNKSNNIHDLTRNEGGTGKPAQRLSIATGKE